jgi:putative membrane protein
VGDLTVEPETHFFFDRTDRNAVLTIVAAGILVDLLCRLVPAGLPYIMPFIFNAPVFLGTWLFAFWYARGLIRTETAARPPQWRRYSYFAGLALIYFVLQTHFEYLAQHMFFLDRFQQMSIGVFGPFLLAFSWPQDTLERGIPMQLQRACRSGWVSRPLTILRHPLIAALIAIVVTDVWLLPRVNFISMLDPMLYQIMNLSMIGAGLLFWFVVLDPRPRPVARYSFMARMLAGFLTMFPQIGVAAYVALTSISLYDFYDLCGRIYPGISPIHDQLIGGMIQWIPPGMLNTAVLFVLLTAIRKHEDKQVSDMPIPPGAKVYEAKWTGR